MALLPPARLRVTTSAGVPVSGGKLRLYNANTSTPSTLYSDSGLSVPLSNPVVAASDGFLPQIFAAEGLVVDGDYLTSGGVVISGQSFEDAVFVGQSTGAFTRDFTSSRVRIAGSAGITSVEAGDPLGDDVGGTMRLGGYNSTQGDALSLDFASIDTTTNTFKVNGKRLPGVVDSAAVAFSGSANVIIPLSNTPTGVRAWQLEIIDFQMTAGQLYGTISYDTGVTYKSGASDYQYVVQTASAGAVSATSASATTHLQFTNVARTSSNKPGRLNFDIATPNSGSDITVIASTYAGYESTPAPGIETASNFGLGGYGRATHLKLTATSGNISGLYRLIPKRGFGE